MNISVYYNSK